jgi:hypothetical protein
MTEIFDDFIDHPAAWKGCDVGGKDAIAFDLGPEHLSAFEAAIAAVRGRGLEPEHFGREDFDLSAIAGDIAAIRDTVMNGHGVIVLRGFPVERWGVADMALVYWGLGTHLGQAVSQSRMGDRLGHVVDVSGDNPRERGYRSSKELEFHTDSDDIVGLMCLAGAKAGGVSRLVSALAIHNEMRASHPEHLVPLYAGFAYHWRGEEPPGEPPITDYRVPVFSTQGGVVSCCYLRHFITMAAAERDTPPAEHETAALDCFDAIANREDMVFSMTLEPGELMLFNNYVVLHSRTGFVDHAEPERRRHLLRLWLKAHDGRPVAPLLRRYYGVNGIAGQGDGDTIYQGETVIAKEARPG